MRHGVGDSPAFSIDDNFIFGIAAQNAAHVTNIVQQTGDDQVAIIFWLYSLGQRHSL
jgi:hypothetical protein